METAGKLIDDEELREAMKDSGLGTPATRAETIEALIRREYIERVGSDLQPTPKGLQVITMLEEHKITSPELTATGSTGSRRSSTGRRPRRLHVGRAGFTDEIVKQIAALDKEKLRPVRVELGLCPRCGPRRARSSRRTPGPTAARAGEPRGDGCGFVIWKKVAGRTLTPEIARQLLEEGGRVRYCQDSSRARANTFVRVSS
jgi:DNA topoisomerase-3